MAEAIASAYPSMEVVRLVSSGTEAAMSAIRLARGATGRDVLVKFDGGYHGHADSLLVKAGSGGATFSIPDSKGVPAALAALTVTLEFNDLAGVRELFHRRGGEIAGHALRRRLPERDEPRPRGDEQVVDVAVVAARELQHAVAAREPAGEPDRRHRCLRPG